MAKTADYQYMRLLKGCFAASERPQKVDLNGILL